MEQYEFRLRAQDRTYTAYCTAPTQADALHAMRQFYSGLAVEPEPLRVLPPHHVYGELDASES